MTASVTYPVGTIAKLLLLTERRVQQLASEGIIPRAEKNRYELAPVIQAYVRYLRDRHVTDGGGDELGVSKARLVKARARAAEMEADAIEGSLLRRAEVEAAWSSILLNVRSSLLGLPSRAAPATYGASSLHEAAAVLADHVNEALDELSTTPVYALSDVSGAAGEAGADGAGGAEGTDVADAEPVGDPVRGAVGGD